MKKDKIEKLKNIENNLREKVSTLRAHNNNFYIKEWKENANLDRYYGPDVYNGPWPHTAINQREAKQANLIAEKLSKMELGSKINNMILEEQSYIDSIWDNEDETGFNDIPLEVSKAIAKDAVMSQRGRGSANSYINNGYYMYPGKFKPSWTVGPKRAFPYEWVETGSPRTYDDEVKIKLHDNYFSTGKNVNERFANNPELIHDMKQIKDINNTRKIRQSEDAFKMKY